MDLLEPSLLDEAIDVLFLWSSGEDISGLGMTFELLRSEPEHFIFLHFLPLPWTVCSRCFCC